MSLWARRFAVALAAAACFMVALWAFMSACSVTGCTPAERQTIATDLPRIVAGTDAVCVVAEGSLATSAAGPVVDMICTGTEGLEALTQAVLSASPGATAVVTTVADAGPDAGARPAVALLSVRVDVAKAVLGSCVVVGDAGGG